MKFGVLLGGLAGAGLAAWLLANFGFGQIMSLIGNAGWLGVGVFIAFHLIQVLFSAAAWREITGAHALRPSLLVFVIVRGIREGVNNLLPVAQIGGEFVASRVLQRLGLPLPQAIGGSVADLTLEMITQIAFTLLGLGLLVQAVGNVGIVGYVVSGLLVAVLAAAGFVGAQWLGLATYIEKGLLRLGRMFGWSRTANVEGLHEALIGCYRSPRRVAVAVVWHMVSWLLGGIEICIGLHFLGHDVDFSTGLVIESLGQALKAAGFAVPGALGIQEGGYIIVCGLFGLSPELAIALSLLKRLREVVLGVPGLLLWQVMEARPTRKEAAALPGGQS